MKNIHILPTDKPNRLYKNLLTDKLFILENSFMDVSECNREYQNIYITSDEYIGLSYYLDGNLVRKGVVDDKDYWEVRKDYKKIILTTDPRLAPDVQKIDDEFLEWFVKHPSCESVKVDKAEHGTYKDDVYYKLSNKIFYKIIIPKEIDILELGQIIPKEEHKERLKKILGTKHPKQENCCTPIGQIKRYVDCKGCDRKPKQETLEEAAHKMLHDYGIKSMGQSIGVLEVKKLMVLFAKEQQERSYSELVDLLERLTTIYKESSDLHQKYDKQRLELIEQFKNK